MGMDGQNQLLLQKLSEIISSLESLDSKIGTAYTGMANELVSQKKRELAGMDAALLRLEQMAQRKEVPA